MKTAVLGGGMVGLCYTQAFLEQGHALVGLCDMQPSAAARQAAAAAGATVHAAPGGWLAQADAVVSAVFGAAALPLLEASLPHLRPGTLYVDMTTADPADMRACAALARGAGIDFVDVAITGAVNLGGARTPLLLAGEKALQAQQLFAPLGAPLRTLMESMVRTHIPHSARRCDEVAEAQLQMQRQGLSPRVSPAVQALFAATAQAQAAQPFQGDGLEDAIAWLQRQVLGGPQA